MSGRLLPWRTRSATTGKGHTIKRDHASPGLLQPAAPLLRGLVSSLALTVLLVLCVQSLSLVPLLSHWACDDHCETTADCHPDGGGDTGCDDPSCGCLGCPSHGGVQALLSRVDMPGHPHETHDHHFPAAPNCDRQALSAIFRPPCG